MNGDVANARKAPSRRKYQFVNSSSLLHGCNDVQSFSPREISKVEARVTIETEINKQRSDVHAKKQQGVFTQHNYTSTYNGFGTGISNKDKSYTDSSATDNTDDNVFTHYLCNGNSNNNSEEDKTALKNAVKKKVKADHKMAKERRGRRHTVAGTSKVNMDDIEKWIDENSQKSGKNISKDDCEIYLAGPNVVRTKMAETRRNYVIRNNRELRKEVGTVDCRQETQKERGSCSTFSSNREFGAVPLDNDSSELRLSNLLSLGINNRTSCFLSPRPFNRSSLQHYSLPWNRKKQNMESKSVEERSNGMVYDVQSGKISNLGDDGDDNESLLQGDRVNENEITESKYLTSHDLSKLGVSPNSSDSIQHDSTSVDKTETNGPLTQNKEDKNVSKSLKSSDITNDTATTSNHSASLQHNDSEINNLTVEKQEVETQVRPTTLQTCYISPSVTVKTPTLTPDSKRNMFRFKSESLGCGDLVNKNVETDGLCSKTKDKNLQSIEANEATSNSQTILSNNANANIKNSIKNCDVDISEYQNSSIDETLPLTTPESSNNNWLDHAIKDIEKIADNLATQICDEVSNTSPLLDTKISISTEISNNDSGIETEDIIDAKLEFKASSPSEECLDLDGNKHELRGSTSSEQCTINLTQDFVIERSSSLDEKSTTNNTNIASKPSVINPHESFKFTKIFNENAGESFNRKYASTTKELNIQASLQGDKFIKTNAVKANLHSIEQHHSKERNVLKSGLKRLYQIAISTLESGCPGVQIKDVLTLFESKGIRFCDPRLKETFRRIEIEPEGAETPLNIEVFSRICEPSFKFIRSVLLSQLTIPGFSIFKLRMTRIFERIKENLNLEIDSSTKPHLDPFSNYNEMMKRKNSDKTGISLSICTVDGQRISFGESESPFPLNSCASVFNFCLTCKLNGIASTTSYLGRQPKPLKESEFNFDEHSKVWNPFTKAGTFLATSLLFREMAVENRLEKLHEFYSKLIGGESLCCDNLSYNYKRIYGHEEIALAYYLSATQRLPRNSSVDVTDLLDLMFQSTSTAMTTDACAVGAATLANDGVCPLTGCIVAPREVTRHTLNVMRSSEVITSSLNKEKQQGIALNWSENGSLMLVIPGVLGMACFTHCQSSAKLEKIASNLVEDLIKDFNFGVYRSLRVRRDDLFPK